MAAAGAVVHSRNVRAFIKPWIRSPKPIRVQHQSRLASRNRRIPVNNSNLSFHIVITALFLWIVERQYEAYWNTALANHIKLPLVFTEAASKLHRELRDLDSTYRSQIPHAGDILRQE